MIKALLADTNFSSKPIYDYLIGCGFDVYVCGANPADFLARTAKNYINLDYSNIEKTRCLIDKLGINYVVPGCNDRSYQTCAELNIDGRYPGLDCPTVVDMLNNKRCFREFAMRLGLPVPRIVSIEQIQEALPVMVKPADAFSGRGITAIHQYDEILLSDAVNRAAEYSRSGTYVIEEYVTGQLYSHSAFIRSGKIYVDFIVEEYGSANPYVVDTSRVVDDFPADILQQIRENILHIVSELDLVDGLIHTQFIINDNAYWLIEVTRRCPGDLYAELIERSTGFSYAAAYTGNFVDKKLIEGVMKSELSHILRHTVSMKHDTIFHSMQFNRQLQIERFLPLCVTGDSIKASPFGRIGLLFIKALTKQDLINLMHDAMRRDLYIIH